MRQGLHFKTKHPILLIMCKCLTEFSTLPQEDQHSMSDGFCDVNIQFVAAGHSVKEN